MPLSTTGTAGDVDRRIMPIFEHYLPLMDKAVSRAVIARTAAARRNARDKQPTEENSSESSKDEWPKVLEGQLDDDAILDSNLRNKTP